MIERKYLENGDWQDNVGRMVIEWDNVGRMVIEMECWGKGD